MKPLILFAFLLFCSTRNDAEVIVHESFDAVSTDWNDLFSSSHAIAGGALTLSGSDSLGSQWVVRKSPKIANFTLSVDITMSSVGTNGRSGVTVRTQDNADSYHFYLYPSGEFIISKYLNGQWSDYSSHIRYSNSFIQKEKNTIKVVVIDSTMSFLCNGQKLATITDNSIATPGLIGFITGGIVTASFDNLVIDNAPFSDAGLTHFSDDFSTNQLLGFANYSGHGTFVVADNKLAFTAENSPTFSFLSTDGDYGSEDTLSVLTERVAPVPTGSYLYGLMFHTGLTTATEAPVSTRSYIFCIVNGSYYALYKQLGSTITPLLDPQVSLSILPIGNALKVISSKGNMDLYINNTLVKSVKDTSFLSGGAALIGSGGVKINFDDFTISAKNWISPIESSNESFMTPANIKANPNPFNPSTTLSITASAGTNWKVGIYSPTGKLITRFTGKGQRSILWNGAGYASGLYVARMTVGNKAATRQLLLVK